jgi:hypothetical protein
VLSDLVQGRVEVLGGRPVESQRDVVRHASKLLPWP